MIENFYYLVGIIADKLPSQKRVANQERKNDITNAIIEILGLAIIATPFVVSKLSKKEKQRNQNEV